MNELKVINLDSTDITTWDFQALKAELQAYLSEYAGLVYTDETIKDAKKDRTTLNKAKKVVEDARKAYKARCLEPYEAMEPQIKELTGLIEDRRQQIDEIVTRVEQKAYASMDGEISSEKIGGMVMSELKELNDVAYVRFAAVYRKFTDVGTFMNELQKLVDEKM